MCFSRAFRDIVSVCDIKNKEKTHFSQAQSVLVRLKVKFHSFHNTITEFEMPHIYLIIRFIVYLNIDVSVRFSHCLLVHQKENRIKCIWY